MNVGLALAVLLGACNSGSSTGTGGAAGASSHTGSGSSGHLTMTSSSSGSPTSSTGTMKTDAGSATDGGDGGSTSACSGATPVALTVKNYKSWCSVSVAGGSASSGLAQTVCVATGSVTLDATALSGFKLGDWHGTSGDTGSGDPGTVTGTKSEAMITVSGSTACAWVCCPFTDGTGCTAIANQCP